MPRRVSSEKSHRLARIAVPQGLAEGLRLAPPALLTLEAQLTVTNPTVLRRALLPLLAASPASLDALVELPPAMPPRVLLQPLLLGPSVLKPNLPQTTGNTFRGHLETPMSPPQALRRYLKPWTLKTSGWKRIKCIGSSMSEQSVGCPLSPQPEPHAPGHWS